MWTGDFVHRHEVVPSIPAGSTARCSYELRAPDEIFRGTRNRCFCWEVRFEPWEHPHQGVVALAGSDRDDPTVRINEAIPLVRHGTVITGWAAAYRHGVTMLGGRSPWPQVGSASPCETRTRYVAERIEGIEGLKANVPLFDSAGCLIAIVDLLHWD